MFRKIISYIDHVEMGIVVLILNYNGMNMSNSVKKVDLSLLKEHLVLMSHRTLKIYVTNHWWGLYMNTVHVFGHLETKCY